MIFASMHRLQQVGFFVSGLFVFFSFVYVFICCVLEILRLKCFVPCH